MGEFRYWAGDFMASCSSVSARVAQHELWVREILLSRSVWVFNSGQEHLRRMLVQLARPDAHDTQRVVDGVKVQNEFLGVDAKLAMN